MSQEERLEAFRNAFGSLHGPGLATSLTRENDFENMQTTVSYSVTVPLSMEARCEGERDLLERMERNYHKTLRDLQELADERGLPRSIASEAARRDTFLHKDTIAADALLHLYRRGGRDEPKDV